MGLEGGELVKFKPHTFTPGYEPQYTPYRRLDGPHSEAGCFRENNVQHMPGK